MNEFEIIKTYFAPLSLDGLVNDGAVMTIPDGYHLAISSDTLNAGVHFMPEAAPENIAHKALRVNLSDLAAMGAKPLAYQLNIAFPDKPTHEWLSAFTNALKHNQDEFGIVCSGGDTTRINGPLSIAITAMGTVKKGQALTRSNAQPGDAIVLTGPVGDSRIGLQILQNKLSTENDDYFIERHYKPTPRFLNDTIGIHAAIDISDGFMADLGHICAASDLSAHINLAEIPFSKPAHTLLNSNHVTPEHLLTGGEDYELILAVPKTHAAQYGTIIGEFKTGSPDVHVYDQDGNLITFQNNGWTHF